MSRHAISPCPSAHHLTSLCVPCAYTHLTFWSPPSPSSHPHYPLPSPSDAELVSIEQVAQRAVADGVLSDDVAAERVHTAYGMSKDFGMNGFRVGCLHTRNKDLLEVRCP